MKLVSSLGSTTELFVSDCLRNLLAISRDCICSKDMVLRFYFLFLADLSSFENATFLEFGLPWSFENRRVCLFYDPKDLSIDLTY